MIIKCIQEDCMDSMCDKRFGIDVTHIKNGYGNYLDAITLVNLIRAVKNKNDWYCDVHQKTKYIIVKE